MSSRMKRLDGQGRTSLHVCRLRLPLVQVRSHGLVFVFLAIEENHRRTLTRARFFGIDGGDQLLLNLYVLHCHLLKRKIDDDKLGRSEERRVGKECRYRWS